MKKIMFLLIVINLWSCGKTELDKKSDAPQVSYICSNVPSCIPTCGQNPMSGFSEGLSKGQSRESWANVNTSNYDSCLARKVQIVNGVIVNAQ